MNKKNRDVIRKRIAEAAEKLHGRLPESPRHPSGRNPYAHIPKVLKSVFGMSYTDVPDEHLDVIIDVIDYCEKYPF
tara:strand:- start:3218 stop:3445 length:228 start_codon:yes stop_codon:yes gene_type:complete